MSVFKRNKDQAPVKKRELVTDDAGRELSIDDAMLNQELMDQPLSFKKWTNLLAGVSKKAKIIKLTLDEKKAETVTKYSSDGTGKKVKEIEASVAMDPEVRKLERELIDAEEMVDQYTGIVKAFYQRHEMLKDLCANKRREFVD